MTRNNPSTHFYCQGSETGFFLSCLFANTSASPLHLAGCNIAGNSPQETLTRIAAGQFKAEQASNFRGSGWTKRPRAPLWSCKHSPAPFGARFVSGTNAQREPCPLQKSRQHQGDAVRC